MNQSVPKLVHGGFSTKKKIKRLSAVVFKEQKVLRSNPLQTHHLIVQGLSFLVCQMDMTTLALLTPLSMRTL